MESMPAEGQGRQEEAKELETELVFYIQSKFLKDDLKDFKSAVEHYDGVAPAVLEKCTSFSEVWLKLHGRRKVPLGDYQFVIKCLKRIEKDQLIEKVKDTEDDINNILGSIR